MGHDHGRPGRRFTIRRSQLLDARARDRLSGRGRGAPGRSRRPALRHPQRAALVGSRAWTAGHRGGGLRIRCRALDSRFLGERDHAAHRPTLPSSFPCPPRESRRLPATGLRGLQRGRGPGHDPLAAARAPGASRRAVGTGGRLLHGVLLRGRASHEPAPPMGAPRRAAGAGGLAAGPGPGPEPGGASAPSRASAHGELLHRHRLVQSSAHRARAVPALERLVARLTGRKPRGERDAR
jgi:hypothetical protein